MSETLTQGQRIRKLRIERRYTQEYLADHLGTTKQAIYKYEADIVQNIPPEKLLRLAQLLGCSVEYLQGEAEEPGAAPETPFSACAAGDPFRFYQEFTAVLSRLSEAERAGVMAYAQFLLSRHQKG
ncbi:MAG: helix-turn-helix domain-containing protein [Faecalibacterium sp.]|jgi:transcriptional regulator with XRE-family HTH domain|nr:helix-turn-helix domain-containing protein [Faecalibacterium sp.]